MARLVDGVRRFAGLAHAERGIALRAVVLLTVMPLLVRVLGLPRLLRAPTSSTVAVAPARTQHLVSSVATCLPWTTSCLSESLAAARLVAAAGGSVAFVLGVAAPGRPFEAHAWLEFEGGAVEPAAPGRWCEVSRWIVGARRP